MQPPGRARPRPRRGAPARPQEALARHGRGSPGPRGRGPTPGPLLLPGQVAAVSPRPPARASAAPSAELLIARRLAPHPREQPDTLPASLRCRGERGSIATPRWPPESSPGSPGTASPPPPAPSPVCGHPGTAAPAPSPGQGGSAAPAPAPATRPRRPPASPPSPAEAWGSRSCRGRDPGAGEAAELPAPAGRAGGDPRGHRAAPAPLLTFHPVDDLARRPLADGFHDEGHGRLGGAGLGRRRSPGEGRGCAWRRDRAARNPRGGRTEPLYPRLPPLRSLARRLCASLGISVHVAGSAGRGRRRRKGEKGAARSDASRPRQPAGSGGGSGPRREVGPGRRRARHRPDRARSGARRLPGSPRPRLLRRCLFLLAEMTRRLLLPENISK